VTSEISNLIRFSLSKCLSALHWLWVAHQWLVSCQITHVNATTAR